MNLKVQESYGPPKCPDCGLTLIRWDFRRERDGTEITDYLCPGCRGRFGDTKIPRLVIVG